MTGSSTSSLINDATPAIRISTARTAAAGRTHRGRDLSLALSVRGALGAFTCGDLAGGGSGTAEVAVEAGAYGALAGDDAMAMGLREDEVPTLSVDGDAIVDAFADTSLAESSVCVSCFCATSGKGM